MNEKVIVSHLVMNSGVFCRVSFFQIIVFLLVLWQLGRFLLGRIRLESFLRLLRMLLIYRFSMCNPPNSLLNTIIFA